MPSAHSLSPPHPSGGLALRLKYPYSRDPRLDQANLGLPPAFGTKITASGGTQCARIICHAAGNIHSYQEISAESLVCSGVSSDLLYGPGFYFSGLSSSLYSGPLEAPESSCFISSSIVISLVHSMV